MNNEYIFEPKDNQQDRDNEELEKNIDEAICEGRFYSLLTENMTQSERIKLDFSVFLANLKKIYMYDNYNFCLFLETELKGTDLENFKLKSISKFQGFVKDINISKKKFINDLIRLSKEIHIFPYNEITDNIPAFLDIFDILNDEFIGFTESLQFFTSCYIEISKDTNINKKLLQENLKFLFKLLNITLLYFLSIGKTVNFENENININDENIAILNGNIKNNDLEEMKDLYSFYISSISLMEVFRSLLIFYYIQISNSKKFLRIENKSINSEN